MPDSAAKPAIRISGVRKDYRLYDSLSEQALDVLGLSRLRFWRPVHYKTFKALDGIDLEIKRGERVGIVGRNGAGKTTLLKLITGNFAPTSGTIEVDGMVQALMQTGLGFHGEFTGLENIRSALVYNGLQGDELESSVEDIIDFCELGDFIHHPVKTYSLGMRARLQFAAATAIKPDIVIIDEVLGAGDAYFAGQSAARVKRLTGSGATLLIVSHSSQQVLQFCERAIWLECGRVVMDGEALPVVRAYEEYSHKLEHAAKNKRERGEVGGVLGNRWAREELLMETLATDGSDGKVDGGVSRWEGLGGLRIEQVQVLDGDAKLVHLARTGEPLTIRLRIKAEKSGQFTARYVVLLFTSDGRILSRHVSEYVEFDAQEGDTQKVDLVYPQLFLGNGDYVFSAAIYKKIDLANVSSSSYYDLLSRSFSFSVRDRYLDDQSVFHHPNVWSIGEAAR